jgi:hypothetical protein
MSMTAGTHADTMRTAAGHMRQHHGPKHPRHRFWTHLADLLDNEAAEAERGNRFGDEGVNWVLGGSTELEIAEAYLDSLDGTP